MSEETPTEVLGYEAQEYLQSHGSPEVTGFPFPLNVLCLSPGGLDS